MTFPTSNTCNLPVLKIIFDELLILSQGEKPRYLRVRRIDWTEKYVPDWQIMRVIFSNQVPCAAVVRRSGIVSPKYHHCQRIVLKLINFLSVIWREFKSLRIKNHVFCKRFFTTHLRT